MVIVDHGVVALGKGVSLGHFNQVFACRFAKVVRNDDPEIPVAIYLVVVDFHTFVDLAQRHVDFDEQHIVLVVRVGVQNANELELSGLHREVFVDQKLVGRLEQKFLHRTPGDRVGGVLPVKLLDQIGTFDLQFLLICFVLDALKERQV